MTIATHKRNSQNNKGARRRRHKKPKKEKEIAKGHNKGRKREMCSETSERERCTPLGSPPQRGYIKECKGREDNEKKKEQGKKGKILTRIKEYICSGNVPTSPW